MCRGKKVEQARQENPPKQVKVDQKIPGKVLFLCLVHTSCGHLLTECVAELRVMLRFEICHTHTTEVGKTYQTWHKHFFETCDEQSQVHILQIPVNGFSND